MGAPAAAGGEREQTTGFLTCSLAGAGERLFFIWGEGRGVSRIRLELWLRCFAHPLGVLCSGTHTQYPAFAPGSSKVVVGFLVSLYLLSRICPNCSMQAVIFSPI